MTTASTKPKKVATNTEFQQKRADLFKQLELAAKKNDKKKIQSLRKQFLSDDLVP